MRKVLSLIPGTLLALAIAFAAKWLEGLEKAAGLHIIGASVIALFIGMAVNAVWKPNSTTAPGIKFTSKKLLKFAIILLGASLNIRTVLTVGKFSLTVMVFTLATCFGLGTLIGKALGLSWKTSSLINAGTGICGGSAIAAIAPVIEADDMDIAYGMSATFLFDTVMVVVFPLLGRWMGLSDAAFGLWAGTAVNDTSSVVATGYAFSEAAGDFATMVKLTRTLSIIPAVLVFAAVNLRIKRKEKFSDAHVLHAGSHQRHFPVVYPGLPRHVRTGKPEPPARRGRLRHEDRQQIPDGCRAGGDRPQHKLQVSVPFRRQTYAPRLHRLTAGGACGHRRGVRHRHRALTGSLQPSHAKSKHRNK